MFSVGRVGTRCSRKLAVAHALLRTSRPTTHSDPTFIVDGVLHYCVANMSGAVPATSTHALANGTLPYLQRLADGGIELLRTDPHLRNGVNITGGRLTNAAVAHVPNRPYVAV